MKPARLDPANVPAAAPGGGHALSANVIRRAAELQRRIFENTGRWMRLGEILLVRGDVSEDDWRELASTALFPREAGGSPDMELVGEIALRRGLINPEQYFDCLRRQIDDCRSKRPHRPIRALLVDSGLVGPADLEACEDELRRDARLHAAETRRASREEGERPPLAPLDAQYVTAVREGTIRVPDLAAVARRLRALQKLVGRRIALWEHLVATEIVAASEHRRLLEAMANVRDSVHGSWLLGGILVELGYATPAQVRAALFARNAEEKKGKPRPLGEHLIERGIITATELEEALRIQVLRRGMGWRQRWRGPKARWAAAVAAAMLVMLCVASLAWPQLRARRAEATVADRAAPTAERIAAAGLLGTAPAGAPVPALLGTGKNASEPLELRFACLKALAGTRDSAVDEALRAVLTDPRREIRTLAAFLIGDRKDTGARAALRSRLNDPAPSVRLAAARALAFLGESDGRELLVAALDPDRAERQLFAAALKQTEDQVEAEVARALEALSGFAFGKDRTRWEAWLALQPAADQACGTRRGPAVAARFESLLSSESLPVRFAAARALAHLGDPSGLPLLIEALDPRDTSLRRSLLEERGVDVRELQSEIATLLWLLTGQDHGKDHAAWRAWLEQNGSGIFRAARREPLVEASRP